MILFYLHCATGWLLSPGGKGTMQWLLYMWFQSLATSCLQPPGSGLWWKIHWLAGSCLMQDLFLNCAPVLYSIKFWPFLSKLVGVLCFFPSAHCSLLPLHFLCTCKFMANYFPLLCRWVGWSVMLGSLGIDGSTLQQERDAECECLL